MHSDVVCLSELSGVVQISTQVCLELIWGTDKFG